MHEHSKTEPTEWALTRRINTCPHKDEADKAQDLDEDAAEAAVARPNRLKPLLKN